MNTDDETSSPERVKIIMLGLGNIGSAPMYKLLKHPGHMDLNSNEGMA